MKKHDTLTKSESSPAQISLWPVEGVNLSERLQYALQLPHAASQTTNLKLELPQVKERYQSPIRAFRSIGQVARIGAEHKLTAYVIASRGNAVGMATTQVYEGQQSPGGLRDVSKPSVELSWWLRNSDQPIEENTLAVQTLAAIVRDRNNNIDPSRLWTVTLPSDHNKSEALITNDFHPVAPPTDYNYLLQDNVTYPRQLWVPDSK